MKEFIFLEALPCVVKKNDSTVQSAPQNPPPPSFATAFMVPPRSAASQICATTAGPSFYLVRLLQPAVQFGEVGVSGSTSENKRQRGESVWPFSRDAVMKSGSAKICLQTHQFRFQAGGITRHTCCCWWKMISRYDLQPTAPLNGCYSSFFVY